MVTDRKRDGYVVKGCKIYCDSSMWSTVRRKKSARDLVVMLSLSEIADLLAMETSVLWYGHILRMS